MARQILMGGSPSTGSSLLVNILDRHSAISAGPETYLFIHPRLFGHWERNKTYLLQTSKFWGLKSEGWFLMNGAQLLKEDYGWTGNELANLVVRSPDLTSFAGQYLSRRMTRTRADRWLEKSPANVITFPLFLGAFPYGSVIHTTRNPYDTAASLLARGHSPYQAAGAYIVNTALALRVLDHKSATLVKYEELVTNPRSCLQSLLAFLDCAWEEDILEPGPAERRKEVKMPGWLQNEKGRIGDLSMNRFERLPASNRRSLVNALALFRINPYFANRHQLTHTSLRTIAETLGYVYREPEEVDWGALKRQMWQDRINRAVRAYPAFGRKYPGGL